MAPSKKAPVVIVTGDFTGDYCPMLQRYYSGARNFESNVEPSMRRASTKRPILGWSMLLGAQTPVLSCSNTNDSEKNRNVSKVNVRTCCDLESIPAVCTQSSSPSV